MPGHGRGQVHILGHLLARRIYFFGWLGNGNETSFLSPCVGEVRFLDTSLFSALIKPAALHEPARAVSKKKNAV